MTESVTGLFGYQSDAPRFEFLPGTLPIIGLSITLSYPLDRSVNISMLENREAVMSVFAPEYFTPDM